MPLHSQVQKYDGARPDHYLGYVCGHCNSKVSGAILAEGNTNDGTEVGWLLCPNCLKGSVRVGRVIHPGVVFGPLIKGLPDEVAEAYEEARKCLAVGAYTGCELLCRKILMHVAVDKGAHEGESFASYISHLEKSGYITPPMKGWADLIRQHGNQATHLLDPPTQERTKGTLMFTAELLRLIYEMEYLKDKYTPAP